MENRKAIEWFEYRIAVMPESETKEMFRMAVAALEKQEQDRGRIMTTVSCLLEKCIYNKDTICTKDTISLSDEHYCIGGCDEGWEFPPEEEGQ